MIEYQHTHIAVEASPRLLGKIVDAHAKRGRRYLTRRGRRHALQVGVALDALKVALGSECVLQTVRLADDVTAIRVETEKFGERRVVLPTFLFRIVRDYPELTGVGWLGKLHGSCLIIHTDHGRQEWGKP